MPSFVIGQVCRKLKVHRYFGPPTNHDFDYISGTNYIKPYSTHVLNYTTNDLPKGLPKGLSCFLPHDQSIHHYYSGINTCYVLNNTLPDGFALVCTKINMGLRIKQKTEHETIKVKAYFDHFNIFTDHINITASEMHEKVEIEGSWTLCTTEEAKIIWYLDDEPWYEEDNNGGSDPSVRNIYQLAKHYYSIIKGMNFFYLNDY